MKPHYKRIETPGRPSDLFVTPDSKHIINVVNGRTYSVQSPGKTSHTLGSKLAGPYVRISPRGDYAALIEEASARKWDDGSNVSILRFSDHAIIATFAAGTDPHWISDTVLAFRVGSRAQRLELPAVIATDVGPPQTTHGCTNAVLRTYGRVEDSMCPGKRYSSVRAVDAAFTKWLVHDDHGGAVMTALRIVDLASGTDRVLADASLGSSLYLTTSPHGTRYCVRATTKAGYELHCGRFPEADDQVKVLTLPSAANAPGVDWLDDDRLLVSPATIIDFARGTRIELDLAELTGTTRLAGTLGPRYVFADRGWTFLLDLETKTWLRLDVTPGASSQNSPFHVVPSTAAGGRMWVKQMFDDRDLTWLDVELTLVPN